MSKNAWTWTLAGRTLTLTHPDKPYFPDRDPSKALTKGDLLRYYRAIAPTMLPHLRNRPLTLQLFPRGITERGYYRRDLPDHAPDWLRSAPYRTTTDPHEIQLPLVDDAAGLLWYANQGAIEFHTWGSSLPHLDQPDWAVFDLDPGPDTPFEDVLEAALIVRDALAARNLRSYSKTSGGRGLHLYLPLIPGYTFDAVRSWVESLARDLAAQHPTLLAVAGGATHLTHQGHRVTIDHAQNSLGRNTAAPYTARAAPGAPVSMPLRWAEVEAGGFTPDEFTIRTAVARVEAVGDLFAGVVGEGEALG